MAPRSGSPGDAGTGCCRCPVRLAFLGAERAGRWARRRTSPGSGSSASTPRAACGRALRVARTACRTSAHGSAWRVAASGSSTSACASTSPSERSAVGYRAGWRAGGARHPGSLEWFLTERYCLYAVDARGRLCRAEIHHRPWRLQPAEAEDRAERDGAGRAAERRGALSFLLARGRGDLAARATRRLARRRWLAFPVDDRPRLPRRRAPPSRFAQGADHRPWPVPSRAWMMAQTWEDMLLAHWRVPPELLEPRLPGRARARHTPRECVGRRDPVPRQRAACARSAAGSRCVELPRAERPNLRDGAGQAGTVVLQSRPVERSRGRSRPPGPIVFRTFARGSAR